MEPSTHTLSTLAGAGAPVQERGSSEETLYEEPGKPAEAPSGSRTPPPNRPPVAVAGGDRGDGGGDGEGDSEEANSPGASSGGSGQSGENSQTGAITRRIYLGRPAETVWRWLVDPELVRCYHLADLAGYPEKVGDPMQFTHRLAGHLLIAGEVLEWVEGRRLSYSYTFLREELEPPSRVTMELIRYGEHMCRLDLRHDELLVGGETWTDVDFFWDIALSALKTWVETGQALPWPGRGRWSDPIVPGVHYPY